MTHRVYVLAPCRLHFGMFSFGHAAGPQFGGVGVMVDPPTVEVTISPADHFVALGQLANRVERFAASATKHWRFAELPRCEVNAISPPDHVGLGVGTQLGLAVAAGLRRFFRLSVLPCAELATAVGRGKRSAIGTYGFQYGGLIVDAGKESGQLLGSLARRVAVPAAWRIVLARVGGSRGLAGVREADAFAQLPPVPDGVTRELWRLTNEEMLPAISRGDCAGFGNAVYQFGRLAGECFAAVQGGPFASPETAQLVNAIREYGAPGVGQSSWGPTVFAIVASDAEAQALAEWLGDRPDCDVVIARPNNDGATVESS